MKIFVSLILFFIESSVLISRNTYLKEHLLGCLNHLKKFPFETSMVLPFGIKLEEQLIEFEDLLLEYLDKEIVEKARNKTNLDELEENLNLCRALYEKDVIEHMNVEELEKLKEELKEKLKNLKSIFEKHFGRDEFEQDDIADFRSKLDNQLKELITFLETTFEDLDISENEFGEKLAKKLTNLENILYTHPNRKGLDHPEVSEFLKALYKKTKDLIDFLMKNQFSEQSNLKEVPEYGLKVREQLFSLIDFVTNKLNVNLERQPELEKIYFEFEKKIGCLVNFIKENLLRESAFFSGERSFQTEIEGNHKNNMITSFQLLPENSQTSFLNDSGSAQTSRFNDQISSINPPNNTVLTESNGLVNEVGPENQHHNERNIQETLSSTEITKSSEGHDLQNSLTTNHSDTGSTSFNLSQKTPNASPVLELQDQQGFNASSKELSIDNLFIDTQGPKDELEPEENLQDNNLTTSKESLKEEGPEVLSINTKDEAMHESQQNVKFNNTIQGDDPKISETLNSSNDEQVGFQNENSIISNTNQIKENPSQISKDNVQKELGKTNEVNLHNNGLVIAKDELKNTKTLEVEKKDKKKVEDVDISEKNKTEPKITRDFKTDLPKNTYDNLKKFANDHSRKKKHSKGVQQKTVFDNDSKTSYSEKDKQLEDFRTRAVLNNHKKSIFEDGHDSSTILRVNGDVSADEKIKVDDGKPQNSVKKNHLMSVKSRPHLYGINPSITLNFTISRPIP